MRYMLVIYGSGDDWTQRPPEENEPILAQHQSFTEDLRKANAFVAAEALHARSSVTTIRMRGTEPVLTDGPFIETKESIGGFYLIDVDNLDQALEWGQRLARFEENAIEVWPVVEM